jgi:hypothetical protein
VRITTEAVAAEEVVLALELPPDAPAPVAAVVDAAAPDDEPPDAPPDEEPDPDALWPTAMFTCPMTPSTGARIEA